MTRRRRYLLWGGEFLALLTVLAVLLPLEARGANGFASPAFETQWRSVEGAVPNFWGPVATAREGQREAYAEGTYNGEPGQRLVQYFDKARMEQTASGGVVTNGLLTVELKTGALQLGNSTFQQYTGAAVGLAGDAGVPGPTYAALSQLPDVEAQQSGAVTRMFGTGANTFTVGTPMTDPNMVFASYLSDPSGKYGQNIPKAFADFLQRIPGGPIPAMGYPVSPAFQANVRVNGVDNVPVVIQAFERKVLTYTPSNAPAFQVEFGNIGQHYHQWRYLTILGGGTPTTAPFASASFAPFGTADATGVALTSTAFAACASSTPIGVVRSTTTSVSALPACGTTGVAYTAPNSTQFALTATADARTYNATSTAIYREYYATSTAIAADNNTYNATSTGIIRDFNAAITATAMAYNATSTAIVRDNDRINATSTAMAATEQAIAIEQAVQKTFAALGINTPAISNGNMPGVAATPSGSAAVATPNATAKAAQTAQAVINATGTAASASGAINNNPGGRPSGPTVPPTPANVETATAQTAAATMSTATSTARATSIATTVPANTAVPTATNTTAPTATSPAAAATATPNIKATVDAAVKTAVAATQTAGPTPPNATSIAGTVIAQITATAGANATSAAATATAIYCKMYDCTTPNPAPITRSVQATQAIPPPLVQPARSASQLVPTIPPPARRPSA